MKNNISKIFFWLVFCLVFVACEQNADVVVCTVNIQNEQLIAEYPTVTITCDLITDATIENVYLHLSPNPEFTDYLSQQMKRLQDGTYTISITDLQEDLPYYARYEVSNRFSQLYVSNMSTVVLTSKPEIRTDTVSQIDIYSAMISGEVIRDNGYSVTTRGICYSTNENPTIDDLIVERGRGLGFFTCELKNLTPSTVYFARAFATNANGTAYGQQISFTTRYAPEILTLEAQSVTSFSALVGGSYESANDDAIISCGICYSFNQHPTTEDMYVEHSVASSFECLLTDLRPNTTFYARAFVKNSYGTAYGNQITFTTLSDIPVVQTLAINNQTANSVDVQNQVVSDGGYTVVERGVCYSTSGTPNINSSKVTNDVGIGAYTCTLSNLQKGTTYYVRAYAINSKGTGYGDIIEVRM